MKYLIWSNQKNKWWSSCRRGYTKSIDEAGRYSEEEAVSICNDANYNWDTGYFRKIPDELPILETIALKLKYNTTELKYDD